MSLGSTSSEKHLVQLGLHSPETETGASWTPGRTGGPGRLFHLQLSGFTSNFLSYLYPPANILFVHFLKENLFLHQFHIQLFGWFGLKHYTCIEGETSLLLVACGVFKSCLQLWLGGLFTLNLISGKEAGCT